MKHYEEYDRKDNNSGVSRNKSNENETNNHKKLKGIIQTVYHISKTRKESSDKDGGSTNEREAHQMKEKGTNRQGERKYDNYIQNDSQNETKITERLRTRSITKEIYKPGDKLLTAQNLSYLEQKTNKTQNVMRHIYPICDMLKHEYNVGIAKDGFTSNVKTPQKNKFQKNTHQNNNTYACKTSIKSLKVLCSFSIRRQKK